MELEYQKIIHRAISQKGENKKFFERLKKLKPKNLDQITNQLHEEAFEHIDCLQCANCCTTTGPLLKEKDIVALAAATKMKQTAFTEKYLRVDEDQDYVFKSHPCPFLGHDKYCSVYESRPKACAEYPHTQQNKIYNKLNITYLNTMICPAVAEVVERLKKIY
jgi:Fe-S-cluster containining protein